MWTWQQLIFEAAMVLTALIWLLCITYVAHFGLNRVWRQRRFSLRDMLVAVTLVVSSVGLLIGMSHEDRDGIPDIRGVSRFGLSKERLKEIEDAAHRKQ